MFKRMSKKQRGGVALIVGLTLPVLIGFSGLVIDLGGLFVAKTELQSALDSCALAAGQELDGVSPDGINSDQMRHVLAYAGYTVPAASIRLNISRQQLQSRTRILRSAM